MGSRKGMGRLKIKMSTRLTVGSDLVSRILTGNEFQTFGAENRKARDPNVNCGGGLRAAENWMSAETS